MWAGRDERAQAWGGLRAERDERAQDSTPSATHPFYQPTPSESLGDGIDYAQRHGHIGEVIRDTLVKLEARGGPDAFINVKYIVPTFAKVI